MGIIKSWASSFLMASILWNKANSEENLES